MTYVKHYEERALNIMKVKTKRTDLWESREISVRKWDLTQDLKGRERTHERFRLWNSMPKSPVVEAWGWGRW